MIRQGIKQVDMELNRHLMGHCEIKMLAKIDHWPDPSELLLCS